MPTLLQIMLEKNKYDAIYTNSFEYKLYFY